MDDIPAIKVYETRMVTIHPERSTYHQRRESRGREAPTDKKWINYGLNNLFPDDLIELASVSIKHRSILASKENMIAGDSLDIDTGDENNNIKAREEFDRIGLLELHAENSSDMALFWGCFNQIVYGLSRQGDRHIARIVKPFYESVRLKKFDQGKFGIPEIRKHFIADEWRAHHMRDKDITTIPAFGFAKKSDKVVSFYIAKKSSVYRWYSVPDYWTKAGEEAILLDAEITSYDYNDLKNGMNAGYIITFFRTELDDEKKEEQLRDKEEGIVRGRMTGTQNTSRVIVQWAEPGSKGKTIDIQEIPSNNDGERHKIISGRNDVNVLAAHGLPAGELAGIQGLTRTGFNSQADYLEASLKIFHTQRIKPLQQKMEAYYNVILKELGFQGKVTIINSLPISTKIDSDLLKFAFTKDEIRRIHGHPKLTEEGKQQIDKDSREEASNASSGSPVNAVQMKNIIHNEIQVLWEKVNVI